MLDCLNALDGFLFLYQSIELTSLLLRRSRGECGRNHMLRVFAFFLYSAAHAKRKSCPTWGHRGVSARHSNRFLLFLSSSCFYPSMQHCSNKREKSWSVWIITHLLFSCRSFIIHHLRTCGATLSLPRDPPPPLPLSYPHHPLFPVK